MTSNSKLTPKQREVLARLARGGWRNVFGDELRTVMALEDKGLIEVRDDERHNTYMRLLPQVRP